MTIPRPLDGFWGGTYSYSNAAASPVSFDAALRQSGARLSGDITEPNSFSPAPTALLHAYVEGIVTGREVRFVKTYDGEGALHAVTYEGWLREDDAVIEGEWHVGGGSGRFLMRRDPHDGHLMRAGRVAVR